MVFPRIRTLAASAAIACVSTLAVAGAGVVKLRNSDAQEAAGGTWRLFMTFSLPKPPSMPHVPMKFVFTEQVRFERTLVDGSDDPLHGHQEMDVMSPADEASFWDSLVHNHMHSKSELEDAWGEP